MLKEHRKYWLWLALLIAAVFVLNMNHINQQAVYSDYFKATAENILSGAGYTNAEFDYKPAYYPLWGYTGIVLLDVFFAGSSGILLSVIQYLLCFSAIYYFYKAFQLKPRYYHLALLLPFIALCSVKWPDAIVGCLTVFIFYNIKDYLNTSRLRKLILAGAFFGITVNFRSEYIYLPLFLAVFILLPSLKNFNKKIIYTAAALFISSLLFLLPWSIRSLTQTGEYRLGASNGWSVMYISLGQLPGNPWEIAPFDKSAFDFTKKSGIYPYTPQGDKLLKDESLKLIKENPLAYAEKAGYNFLMCMIRGVYTGEYGNIAISEEDRYQADAFIESHKGISGKISSIFKLPPAISIPYTIEKLIQAVFVIFFFVLMVNWFFFRNRAKINQMLLLSVAAFALHKLVLVSLIQYEYRHMNSIYLLLLGLFFAEMPFIRDKIKFWKKKETQETE